MKRWMFLLIALLLTGCGEKKYSQTEYDQAIVSASENALRNDALNYVKKHYRPEQIYSNSQLRDALGYTYTGDSVVSTDEGHIVNAVGMDSGTLVWKSRTGSKYHNKPDCGRMNPKAAEQITIEQALAEGLEACDKCF